MTVIEDSAMEWKLGCCTKWACNAEGLIGAGGASTSLGAGGQQEEMQADAEVCGVSMDTGDEVYFLFDLLAINELGFANRSKDLLCEVLFGSDGGTGDTGVDWTAHIKGFANAAALSDTKVAADGSITFPACTTGAAGNVMKTSRKGFNLTSGVFASDEFVGLAVTLADKGDAAADELELWGVRVFFEIQATDASGYRQRL